MFKFLFRNEISLPCFYPLFVSPSLQPLIANRLDFYGDFCSFPVPLTIPQVLLKDDRATEREMRLWNCFNILHCVNI